MNYYTSISKGYNELHMEEQLDKISIIKDNIKIDKSSKVLDVGCGTGISSDFDCFVVGVDPSIGMLRQNKKLKVISVAECLPFKNHLFDYVISVTSLHNFSNITESINEMKRVGKQYFVFSVLKKSGKFSYIKGLIEEKFRIESIVEYGKDMIFFCKT